jgi:hypothetical protein
MTTYETLRIPRGLWADLEETVIQQDRQFLSEIARALGLPVQEVLRRCLGSSGTPQQVPVLWTNPEELASGVEPLSCPWWERHGDGLWRPCPRVRLSASLPCHIHERSMPCPLTRLASDPVIRGLTAVVPATMPDGELLWYDPTNLVTGVFCEDGRYDPDRSIRVATNREGERVLLVVTSLKPNNQPNQ